MNFSFVDRANPVVDGWTASALRQTTDWHFPLAEHALEEVRAHLDRNGGSLSCRILDTEFPTLATIAPLVRNELGVGVGLAWLRPSSIDHAEDHELSAMFSIICSLLGMAHRTIRSPDPIIDLEPRLVTAHLDGLVPDVVGSVCLQSSGTGAVLLCSAPAVHDDLSSCSTILRQLYRPLLQGSASGGWMEGPIFRYERRSRSLEFRYDRSQIELAVDGAGLTLDPSLRNAMDTLDNTLNSPELQTSIQTGRGDMLLVNNRRVATAGIVNAHPPGHRSEIRGLRVVNPG